MILSCDDPRLTKDGASVFARFGEEKWRFTLVLGLLLPDTGPQVLEKSCSIQCLLQKVEARVDRLQRDWGSYYRLPFTFTPSTPTSTSTQIYPDRWRPDLMRQHKGVSQAYRDAMTSPSVPAFVVGASQ